MTDPKQLSENMDYKDRKVGLVLFGVIQVIIGAFCVLAVPLMLVGMLLGASVAETAGPQSSVKMMIPGLLLYLGAAVWFVWLGIGSILARRWARALILVASWLFLLCGIGGILFWLVLSPGLYEQMGQAGGAPDHLLTVMRHVTSVVLAVVYILLPSAFVLFYRSRHVKATCDARDEKTRWTDRCPLPVLALVLMFALWSVSLLTPAVYNFALPFFGTIVSGGVGAVVCLVAALASGYAAWGACRLKPAAWFTALILVLSFGISSAITFSRFSLMDYYARMGFPEDQMEMFRQMKLSTPAMIVPMFAMIVLFLAYLLYTKRYFRAAEPSR